jgi:uncharacterized protein
MATNPQHEPTMEEILASIRKIISEDSNDAAPAAAGAPHAEPDVLELTQEIDEPPPAPKPEPVRAAPPPPPKPEPMPEPDVVFEPKEEPKPVAAAPAPSVSSDDIFSDKTRRAMEDTFSKIPAAVEPPPAPVAAAPAVRSTAMPSGDSVQAVFERAIEHAFDDVLNKWMDGNQAQLMAAVKPLIREWMDAHFPPLLEGAVRNEVERVVKARGGK